MTQDLANTRSFSSWADLRSDLKWPGILALLFTVLLHLAVFLLLPDQLLPQSEPASPAEKNTEYQVTLVEPSEQRYVETNPEAPVNEPDQTDRYSSRSQQAADDSPLSDAGNRPQVDGEEEDASKVLQGQLEQSPPVEPGVYAQNRQAGTGEGNAGGDPGEANEAETQTVAQALPPPDFLEADPVSESGPGSRPEPNGKATEVVEAPDPNAPVELFRRPTENRERVTNAGGGGDTPQQAVKPRPRPRLAPELTTGTVMRSEDSVRRRGVLAMDATFSEFGEYEKQFYAAVQTGWFQEIEFFQPIDTATQVHVRFTLHADGRVTEVEAVQTNASEIATFICETAISKRSPFRPWTREMVRVFGQQRTLTVRFRYL